MILIRLIGILLLLHTYVVYSMEMINGRNNEETALKTLLQKSCYFGHDDFRTFALLNKGCRNAVLDRADQRKEGLTKYIEGQEKPYCRQFMQWNAYGTVCSTILLDKNQKPLVYDGKCKNLFVHRYVLLRNKVVQSKKGTWSKFVCCLPHNPAPTVSKSSTITFYGCGYDDCFPQIFEYSLSAEGNAKEKQCLFAPSDDSTDNYTMIHFLDFPILLKTLLNSHRTSSKTFGWPVLIQIMYHLKGIVLPDDYQTWQKVRGRWNSFDELPDCISNPIVQHYNFYKGFKQENKTLRSQQKLDSDKHKEDHNMPMILLSGEYKIDKTESEHRLRFFYDQIWYKNKYASIVSHGFNNNFLPQFLNCRRNAANKHQEYKEWREDMRDHGGVYFPEYQTIVTGTQDVDTACAYIKSLSLK